jgi:hypothetical protein
MKERRRTRLSIDLVSVSEALEIAENILTRQSPRGPDACPRGYQVSGEDGRVKIIPIPGSLYFDASGKPAVHPMDKESERRKKFRKLVPIGIESLAAVEGRAELAEDLVVEPEDNAQEPEVEEVIVSIERPSPVKVAGLEEDDDSDEPRDAEMDEVYSEEQDEQEVTAEGAEIAGPNECE